MIFPALQALIRQGELDMPVIGVARGQMDLDGLRERARRSLQEHGGIDEDAFARLAHQLQYIDGDYGDPATFARLKQALGGAREVAFLGDGDEVLELSQFHRGLLVDRWESVLGGGRERSISGGAQWDHYFLLDSLIQGGESGEGRAKTTART